MTALHGALIELFEVSAEPYTSVLRFTNTPNEKGEGIVWKGNTYELLPIEAEGFEFSAQGKLPRPTLRIGNVNQWIGALARANNDLSGYRVTRLRTFAKYLDATNFYAGNADADPLVEIPPDIYYVDRKSVENKNFVEWELATAVDLDGVKIPGRQILANICPWRFKGTECNYTGADATCLKTLSACEAKFPTVNLRFGGFPAAGMRRA